MNRPLDSGEAIAIERDWQERNDAVVRLGLAWLQALLIDYLDARDAQDRPSTARRFSPSKATGAARKAYEKARSELVAAEQPAQVDRLSALFRLAPFDEDILLLALAPRLDA